MLHAVTFCSPKIQFINLSAPESEKKRFIMNAIDLIKLIRLVALSGSVARSLGFQSGSGHVITIKILSTLANSVHWPLWRRLAVGCRCRVWADEGSTAALARRRPRWVVCCVCHRKWSNGRRFQQRCAVQVARAAYVRVQICRVALCFRSYARYIPSYFGAQSCSIFSIIASRFPSTFCNQEYTVFCLHRHINDKSSESSMP